MTQTPTTFTDHTPRSWDELSETGLLWLINATVFHPRGVTMALAADGSGWDLLRIGTSHPYRVADAASRKYAFTTIAQVRRPAVLEQVE